LEKVIDPFFLYNSENYFLQTLSNKKIDRELSFLQTFLFNSLSSQNVNSKELKVLEFGGNNLLFANSIKSFFSSITVVDPLAPNSQDESIKSHSMTIEEFTSISSDSDKVDVVIARHTLEHIANPLCVLRNLKNISAGESLEIFIECPSLEQIVSRSRWDSVTHQHVHYFSVKSMSKLFSLAGFFLVDKRLNPLGSNGGSMIYHFSNRQRKSDSNLKQVSNRKATGAFSISLQDVIQSIKAFKTQTEFINDFFSVKSLSGIDICYGASLLLPTLNYHLQGLVESIGLVQDDDPNKSGLGYRNLKVTITEEFSSMNEINRLLVTSLENNASITQGLISRGAPNIFCLQPISAG
jgi:hypothetical protein